MFGDYKITLGVAPTRRMMYDPKHAIENRRRIVEKTRELCRGLDVEVLDIAWLNDEGLLVDPLDVGKVADYFTQKKIDALFVPFCNYGTEEAVAALGAKMKVPFLLYGPRDEAPPAGGDRIRQTDTQCGMLPGSKALLRANVPFTYIENCYLDDPVFAKGFDDFLRTALVVKKMRNMRVGQIGLRPRPFLCMAYNEAELVEKFGISVFPITPHDIMNRMAAIGKERQDEVTAVVQSIEGLTDVSAMQAETMRGIAAMRLAILDVAKELELDAVGCECWTVFTRELGFAPCSVFGDLADCGLPIGCETDVLAAITMSLLDAAARGKHRPFCADLTVRHPDNDNAEMLWHCGPFARSAARAGGAARIVNAKGWWEIEHGPITISRFDSLRGDYSILLGEGKGVDGPPTNGTYSWFEVDDWPRWEKHIVYGPYVHHVACIHGHWADVLEEACRYVPVKPDRP